MFDLKAFGKKGQSKARELLLSKGYDILDQNFTIQGGEIDIIAYDRSSDEVVFVEVKTRNSIDYLDLDETLSSRQVATIQKTAKRYLFKKNLEDKGWRVDHIAIFVKSGEVAKIEHFENVAEL